jgi:DNA-binding SARP family transcriptional activator
MDADPVGPRQANRMGGRPNRAVTPLRIALLGGFRVERVRVAGPVSRWQRRSAKTLTKLLATCPRHALHREQILEILWPGVDVDSALNSFGKALYAARRALEPELLPRESSTYLRFTESMVALDTEHVTVDADHFQQLAERALRRREVAAYEAALAAHGGELLPEDRYEDWCAERRYYLAELHARLLVEMADALEKRGAYSASVDRLHEALQHDPTREDVHRRLMALYALMGSRDQAVRQFHMCQDVLRRELNLQPEKPTAALYQDILTNRIPRRIGTTEGEREVVQSPEVPTIGPTPAPPFVGRDQVLAQLGDQLTRANQGKGHTILVSGEAGIGKTRLLAELAAEAGRRGACVLWGGSGAHANHLAYGPFAVAVEDYVGSRSERERKELAQLYPGLVHFVPSLEVTDQLPPSATPPRDLYPVPAVVGLLTNLAQTQPVLLVLGDLDDLHSSSLDLLLYLTHLAVRRRWLIVGTFREDGLEVGNERWRIIEATIREGLCLHVGLEPLARPDCDRLVRGMLPDAAVGEAVLDHVYAWSRGNPLFVEELVREMRERSELVRSNGSWQAAPSLSGSVPARVRALVAMRMAPIEENLSRVLALAAAADGMEVSLTDLRTGGAALEPPVSEVALFEALDRALDIRILEERDDAYAFRHPLVRSALYEDLSRHRRDQLHAALGHARVKNA